MRKFLYAFLAASLCVAAYYLYSINEWAKFCELAKTADCAEILGGGVGLDAPERLRATSDANDIAAIVNAVKPRKTLRVPKRRGTSTWQIRFVKRGVEIGSVFDSGAKMVRSTKCRTAAELREPLTADKILGMLKGGAGK